MQNKSIAIFTVQNDPHGLVVSTVLREMGHTPVRILMQDYPQITTNTFRFGTKWFEHLYNDEKAIFDAVWMRRQRKAVLANNLVEADRQFFAKEAAMVEAANISIVTDNVFTVNPPAAIKNAENKILQLRQAIAAGFEIPPTIISNNADQIQGFLKHAGSTGCIYKSLLPHSFVSWTENKSLRTASVNLTQLPSDAMLKNGGGIYQHKVRKKFEVRVTIFGRFLRAAKIDSQSHPKGKEDWRSIPDGDLKLEPHDLPVPIQEKCFALLDRLGLVMGCFDFIVTPDNEYIFLEVNQQGQFLWIEQCCPEIALLAPFCEFLASCDPNFSYQQENSGCNARFSFEKVTQSNAFKSECWIEENTQHVPIEFEYAIKKDSPHEKLTCSA